jgi:neutral ceramidase
VRHLALYWFATALCGQPLFVGAAAVDITPAKPVALMGYSNPEQRLSEGVHDRLFARALAFRAGAKRLVLVSCDLSGFQAAPVLFFQKEIFAKFRLAEDELIFCGTHTHSAPMVFLNRTYPHPNNYEYAETLRSKLLEVVGNALRSAVPARLGFACGSSDVGVNRRLPVDGRIVMARNPDGSRDSDVQVLRVETAGGRPLASLFAYASHSRSLTAANRLVSGDIFGIAEQFVEAALGPPTIAPAFAGASGDIDPWYVVGGFDAPPGELPKTVELGNRLGEEVVRVWRGISPTRQSGAIRTRSERLSVPPKVKDTVRSVGITAARIGDVAFLAVDCEALVDVGKAIKARSPFRQTFLLTNCNGGSGYLPPAALYPEGGYEVEISGFAPSAAAMVVDRAVQMLQDVKR